MKNLTIAVVEDLPHFSRLLKAALPEYFEGCQVALFETAEEFLNALRAGNIFNVVIMDGKLDKRNTGPMCLMQARKIVTTIACIGYTDEETLFNPFFEAGAVGVVKKQATLDVLAKHINDFLMPA